MNITDLITITELSRLTNKSRPTLYKYITDYENDNHDNIPYSFIVLFDNIKNNKYGRKEVIDYCKNKFGLSDDEELNDLIVFIKENKDKIDVKELKKILKEAIKDDGNN